MRMYTVFTACSYMHGFIVGATLIGNIKIKIFFVIKLLEVELL